MGEESIFSMTENPKKAALAVVKQKQVDIETNSEALTQA